MASHWPRPTRELALDVGLPAAEVAEPDSVEVDLVDRGQDVDEGGTGPATGLGREASAGHGVAGDDAVDVLHDVEGRAVDGVVGAEPDRGGDRHRCRCEGGDDAVLAADVVGGGEDVAERRPSQHPAPVGGVGDQVREVREATGDQLEPEGRHDRGLVAAHPGRDVAGVDAGRCGRLVHEGLLVGGCPATLSARSATPPRAAAPGARRPPYPGRVTIDVSDATFQTDVLERSMTTPVVVDLWAEWCGPCKTLGPILESVVDETGGQVVLAKVDVDANPATSQAFQVQSIPAVYALAGGKVVDGFVGAQGEDAVREFVARLLPTEEQTEVERLREIGDEASLRAALELEPDDEGAIVDLAELLVGEERGEEALEILARIPETPETRRVAALARSGGNYTSDADIEARLLVLLDQVKADDAARQEFLDLLEILGADDPRSGSYRRQLTSRLF